ncbi:MAG TPA: DUF5668 domain-containing protein [Bryobacteraceae bacterium]|jgi:hypothetical protein|nr:DUF5668 domain-containing protein [Bryobacteraceae bacterium]
MINRSAMFAQAVRGPVMLIVLGGLFALQQDGVLAFSRSWPLLIIAIGVLKLIERMLLGPHAAQYGPPQAPPPAASYAPPSNYPPARPRATQYSDFRTQPPFSGQQPPPGDPKR